MITYYCWYTEFDMQEMNKKLYKKTNIIERLTNDLVIVKEIAKKYIFHESQDSPLNMLTLLWGYHNFQFLKMG